MREIEDRNRSTREWASGSATSRASAAAGLGAREGRDSLGARPSREDLRRGPSGSRSEGGRGEGARTSGGGSGGGSLRNPNSSSYGGQRGDSRPVSPTASIPMTRPGSSNSMRGQPPPQRGYSTEEGAFAPPTSSSATRQGSLRESGYSVRSAAPPEPNSELAYQSVPNSRSNGSLSGSVRQSTERTRAQSPPLQPRIAEPIPPSPDLNPPAPSAPPTGPPPIPLPSAPDQPNSASSDASQAAAQLQSLEALKSADALSRRASKRYSAYAMGKMTSSSTSPGGGREGGRERSGSDLARGVGSGSSAGRELAHGSGEERRGAGPARRAKSDLRTSQRGQAPPLPTMPTSISWNERQLIAPILEETDSQGNSPFLSPSASFPGGFTSHQPASSPELAASPSPAPSAAPSSVPTVPPKEQSPVLAPADAGPQHKRTPTNASEGDSEVEVFPISVFLKIGREVKKAKLEERPTIGDLRLLFIERFQYNPGQADFPSINLRDQSFGVEYLLEDINEVKNGSIISLGIDSKQRRPRSPPSQTTC